jgi:hypothetical protein
MKYFLAVFITICLALPALGSTHYISVLGTEPLFAATATRAQFLAELKRHPQRERAALALLNIDRAAFERDIRSAPSMVTSGPFRLDAMAYYRGTVRVTYDVAVPAGTSMWVIRLPHRTVYVPKICGNISIVATRGIESYRSTPLPLSRINAPLAPVKPLARTPQGQPQARLPRVPGTAARIHHPKFPWWVLLVPVVLIEASHHSTSSPAPHALPTPVAVPTHTPCPTPKPTPTSCPTK